MLRYAVEQGASERTIIEQCLRMGRPLPKAIQNAPDLALGLEFTYAAFWELSTCRPTGWGIGIIPWSAIRDYAASHELDSDEMEDFSTLIRKMDAAYVEMSSKRKETP